MHDKQRPLLLRAFRRTPMRTECIAINHCLVGSNQPLDDWAPPFGWTPDPVILQGGNPVQAVIHAVKALALCGVVFTGPSITHQTSTSTTIQATGNRRYHISQRQQSVFQSEGLAPEVSTRCNFKVKQNLAVTYPGHATESIQLAWEAWSSGDHTTTTATTAAELVSIVRGHGLLLPSQVGGDPRIGPLTPSQIYVKVEWTATIGHNQDSFIV